MPAPRQTPETKKLQKFLSSKMKRDLSFSTAFGKGVGPISTEDEDGGVTVFIHQPMTGDALDLWHSVGVDVETKGAYYESAKIKGFGRKFLEELERAVCAWFVKTQGWDDCFAVASIEVGKGGNFLIGVGAYPD